MENFGIAPSSASEVALPSSVLSDGATPNYPGEGFWKDYPISIFGPALKIFQICQMNPVVTKSSCLPSGDRTVASYLFLG